MLLLLLYRRDLTVRPCPCGGGALSQNYQDGLLVRTFLDESQQLIQIALIQDCTSLASEWSPLHVNLNARATSKRTIITSESTGTAGSRDWYTIDPLSASHDRK
jgi:hypothetical protein